MTTDDIVEDTKQQPATEVTLFDVCFRCVRVADRQPLIDQWLN